MNYPDKKQTRIEKLKINTYFCNKKYHEYEINIDD